MLYVSGSITRYYQIPSHNIAKLSQLFKYWVIKEVLFMDLKSLVGKLNFFRRRYLDVGHSYGVPIML